jgi:hypothetical protein
MKKIYFLVAAISFSSLVSAQMVADFENFTLTPESYNNGSAGNGSFIDESLEFYNFYDAGWMSWNGFSISNITDNITAGWGNQYSAYPGSGANSSNYAIFYPYGEFGFINQNTEMGFSIDSFFITNTTYAAVSMRDGDAFAKQFGSSLDANGVDDGTNGEDFFKVWIIAQGFNSSNRDSIEFYLADYRFSDNSLDYIVDDWLKVDLTPFTFNIKTISFRFESSDNGVFGMNTPSYLAVDNVYHFAAAGISEKENVFDVYPNPVKDLLNVKGSEGEIRVFNLKGELLTVSEHLLESQLDFSGFDSGVYFIELHHENGVSVQKIIK